MFINPICHKSLQATDRNWTVQFPPITFLFTRMVTYTPYRGRKGIILFDHIEGFFISTSLDQGNIALRARLRGTGVLAGTGPSFSDEKSVGNRLGVRPINGLPLVQSLIEFVRQENRTHLRAIITTRAFARIHVAGMFPNICFEIPGLPFQRDKFCVGNDFDVEMSSCLD
jgi:hypothetical protein